MLFSLLKKSAGLARRKSRRPTAAASRFRNRALPRVEALEARWVPATLLVTSAFDDDGDGTLRAKVAAAAAGDKVAFDPTVFDPSLPGGPKTITLDTTKGVIAINKALTIDGSNQTTGADMRITVNGTSGANSTQIFFTNSGDLEIDYLTLANGVDGVGANGGGAVSGQGRTGNLTLKNDKFLSNSTFGSGGAVNWAAGDVTATNCNFRGNHAGTGGALAGVANVTLTNDAFTQNTASFTAGAVYDGGSKAPGFLLKINNTFFEANSVTATTGGSTAYKGGAIDTWYSLEITGGRFTGNSARYAGGAVAYEPPQNVASHMTLSNITFENNSAALGGAVYSDINNTDKSVDVAVSGCLFNGNHAQGAGDGLEQILSGGGLYVWHVTAGTASASLAVSNSTFYNNDSGRDGGGLHIYTRHAGSGSNTSSLTSLTVAKNTGAKRGGGVFLLVDGAARPQVTNSIIALNTNGPSPTTVSPDVYFSSVQGGVTINSGGFNIIGAADGSVGWNPQDYVGTSANPLDPGLDPTGPTDNGGPTFTIKLVTGSAAFRKGKPALGGTTDQRGFTRQADKLSIGAYDPDATSP